jgi:hypothetical protein
MVFQVFRLVQVVFSAIKYVAICGLRAAAIRRRVGVKLGAKA